MGVSSFIGEQRSKQIEGHARPYLDDDEVILYWAHARDPESRKQGYAYVTDRRFSVHWSGRADGHAPIEEGGQAADGIQVGPSGVRAEVAGAHVTGPARGIDCQVTACFDTRYCGCGVDSCSWSLRVRSEVAPVTAL